MTPLWHKQTLKWKTSTVKSDKKCTSNKKRLEERSQLLNYRATPHLTTREPPSKLLFNRIINTKLPELVKQNDGNIQKRDKENKERMKKDADRRRRARVSKLKIGDVVLMRQKKTNKYSTTFDPVRFKVVRTKGLMIMVTRNGKYLTRKISMLKKVKVKMDAHAVDEDYEIDNDETDNGNEQERNRNEQERNGNEQERKEMSRDIQCGFKSLFNDMVQNT